MVGCPLREHVSQHLFDETVRVHYSKTLTSNMLVSYAMPIIREFEFNVTRLDFFEPATSVTLQWYLLFDFQICYFHGHCTAVLTLLSLRKILVVFFVMKTNQMHYFSLIYFVSQPVHVSGMYCPSSRGIHCICTAVGTCYTFKLTGCWPGQVPS
jgi:hypothetical protein